MLDVTTLHQSLHGQLVRKEDYVYPHGRGNGIADAVRVSTNPQPSPPRSSFPLPPQQPPTPWSSQQNSKQSTKLRENDNADDGNRPSISNKWTRLLNRSSGKTPTERRRKGEQGERGGGGGGGSDSRPRWLRLSSILRKFKRRQDRKSVGRDGVGKNYFGGGVAGGGPGDEGLMSDESLLAEYGESVVRGMRAPPFLLPRMYVKKEKKVVEVSKLQNKNNVN